MTAVYKKHLVPGNITFVMSLIFHAWLFICLIVSRPPPRPVIQVVEVNYAPPPPPPKRVRRQVTEQIVRQETPVNKEKDKSVQYLSAHDQKVQKETQAKNGKFNNEKAKGKKQTAAAVEKLPDLSAAFAAKESGDDGKKKDGKEMATDDYLKDVEEGMQTMLNTREFAYYNYYTMIKDRIGQYWEPSIRQKVEVIYKDGRSIASDSEHVTELAIVLDGEGRLLRVEILHSSGNHEIDDMAIKAFHSASPFPKPPKGMTDSTGQIKIRYDFIIQS